jgi:hypothetical protein
LAWAGLWNERAIHNRAALRSTAEVGGGIIVQRMVWARASGVLQTVNLASGQWREMVVNAGPARPAEVHADIKPFRFYDLKYVEAFGGEVHQVEPFILREVRETIRVFVWDCHKVPVRVGVTVHYNETSLTSI